MTSALETQDEFVQLKAAQILTVLLRSLLYARLHPSPFTSIQHRTQISSSRKTTYLPQHSFYSPAGGSTCEARCVGPMPRSFISPARMSPIGMDNTWHHQRVNNVAISCLSTSLTYRELVSSIFSRANLGLR